VRQFSTVAVPLFCTILGAAVLAQTPSKSDLPSDTLAFSLPKMAEVSVRREVYREADGKPLAMDICYPPAIRKGSNLPVVLCVMGYSDASPVTKGPFKQMSAYASWGRLTAAAGMVAVTYQTLAADDTEAALAYVRSHAAQLRVDAERIGLWSCSADSPTAVSAAMREGPRRFRFAVFYYGLMLSPDDFRRKEFDGPCAPRGCYSAELKGVTSLRTDVPLLIARAGKDAIPFVNGSIDHFIQSAREKRVPLTLLDHEAGAHGFDAPKQADARAPDIIKQTLEFMRKHCES
jgi:dienelactone hydrolase